MIIITHPGLRLSARALSRGLSKRLGKNIPVTIDPEGAGGNFIRWGNGAPSSFVVNETGYNDPGYIRTCANKATFSYRVGELGIPVVGINKGTPEKFPVVIRKVLTGSKGVGIEICKDLQEFRTKYLSNFWSDWHTFPTELGVHIFNGRIIKLFKKVREGGMEEEEFPIRNADRGYHFSRVSVENFPKLIPLVENLFARFPIRFGRLDVGWDAGTREYRIIEMNTAPGIAENDNTLEAYLDAFEEVLK